MDTTNLLIDFNSPVHKSDLAQPLIPVPTQIPFIPVPPHIPLSPQEDNGSFVDPFEVKEMKALDPFEEALQCAVSNTNNELNKCDGLQSSANCKTEEILINIQSNCSDTTKTEEEDKPIFSSSHESLSNKKINQESDQVLDKNDDFKDCNVGMENSPNCSSNSDSPIMPRDSLEHHRLLRLSKSGESDSQSQMSVEFSTEESLIAEIANRVNRCIQEALNGSVKTNKKCDNSQLKKPPNRRSQSFIWLSSSSAKNECDRLNKSCTDVDLINSSNLENQQLNASSDSSGFGLLSSNSSQDSAIGTEEEQLFKEARKLSRTFSKLAESFRLEQETDSDDEDIMSCKPRWLYTDSSEDEEEKLLKDPALNFRRPSNRSALSSPTVAPPSCKVSDSPALLAYKTRRSFTHLQTALNNTQEENTMKRSISVGSQMKEVPIIPTLITTGPANPIKADEQPLKLRKKNLGEVKKGPLRAVMPVQNMTKEHLPATGKVLTKQETSPESRIQKPVHAVGTPNKDLSQLNIAPMASSTPNKADSFINIKAISQLSKPLPTSVVNKRHSLEGSFGEHQSRPLASDGARPRSNSVNSSIPRVMHVKPLRGLQPVPKSTSSLTRATHTPINANNVSNVPAKKDTSKLKTNINKARVLADVKTKSPRQSKVRTAVKTISSLVRGKKSSSQDKENRVPV